MAADPNRVRDVFLVAVELAPDQRPSYLAEACRGDVDLRAEVDRLLVANAAPASILEPVSTTTPDATVAFVAGDTGDVAPPRKMSATEPFNPDAPRRTAIATEVQRPDEATLKHAGVDPDATTAPEAAVPAPARQESRRAKGSAPRSPAGTRCSKSSARGEWVRFTGPDSPNPSSGRWP